ncbi:nuclear protein localization protein 4 [Emergomyces africanus]|uniref:Nuclear protein localization protein 4 n=1 Tax=Emergomyces africanus TaxID=1955775 RepID=A0A1B7NYV8_9EURO|nr:nuclear protein localization protein 4 [Emergomyces africanus]
MFYLLFREIFSPRLILPSFRSNRSSSGDCLTTSHGFLINVVDVGAWERGRSLHHNLPKNTAPPSVVLSNKPIGTGGQERNISTLKGLTIERVGLSHGDKLFVGYDEENAVVNGSSSGQPSSTSQSQDAPRRLDGVTVRQQEQPPTPLSQAPTSTTLIKNPWEVV